MKRIMDNSLMHLKRIRKYISSDPNIKAAQIREYKMDGKIMFQPFLVSKDNKFIINRTEYLDKDEIDKVIEKYKLAPRKSDETLFLDLNSVLVKFWKERGEPSRETRIELFERMVHWYRNMGTITQDIVKQ